MSVSVFFWGFLRIFGRFPSKVIKVQSMSALRRNSRPFRGSSEQLLDGFAIADHAQPALDVVEMRARIDAQRMKEGSGQVADVHRPFLGIATDPIGRADDLSALDPAASQGNGIAVAPVVAAAHVVRV